MDKTGKEHQTMDDQPQKPDKRIMIGATITTILFLILVILIIEGLIRTIFF